MMLAELLIVANQRNNANPHLPKILPTVQTDDPALPGIIKLDVDHPNDDKKMAIKDHYIVRTQINAETGTITFFPDGYHQEGVEYALRDAPNILERMRVAIRTH